MEERVSDQLCSISQFTYTLQKRLKYLQKQQRKLQKVISQQQRKHQHHHHQTNHQPPITHRRHRRPNQSSSPTPKPPSYSVHLTKLREIQNQMLLQKVNEANELRKVSRTHKEKHRRYQEAEMQQKYRHCRDILNQEYQAKENVGIFWENKLRELSLQRRRKVEQAKKSLKIVQEQAGDFEKKELRLIDSLNQKTMYIQKINKQNYTNRDPHENQSHHV